MTNPSYHLIAKERRRGRRRGVMGGWGMEGKGVEETEGMAGGRGRREEE